MAQVCPGFKSGQKNWHFKTGKYFIIISNQDIWREYVFSGKNSHGIPSSLVPTYSLTSTSTRLSLFIPSHATHFLSSQPQPKCQPIFIVFLYQSHHPQPSHLHFGRIWIQSRLLQTFAPTPHLYTPSSFSLNWITLREPGASIDQPCHTIGKNCLCPC